jgi:hypothetical protein
MNAAMYMVQSPGDFKQPPQPAAVTWMTVGDSPLELAALLRIENSLAEIRALLKKLVGCRSRRRS